MSFAVTQGRDRAPLLRWRGLAWAILSPVAVLGLLLWPVVLALQGGERFARSKDFGMVLTGARIIRDGDGNQLYDLATQQAAQARVLAPYITRSELLPYNHTPAEALAIAPLVDLPYAVVYALWTLAAIVAVAVAVWLLSHALPVPRATRWTLLGAIVSYPFLHNALGYGQSSPFVLLGLCGTFAALKRGRTGWAGVPLALVVLKPQLLPLLLLFLLLKGHWRTLAVGLGLMAAGTVAAMPVLGLAWPLHYLQMLRTTARWPASELFEPAAMLNWRGLALNLLAGRAPHLVLPLIVVLSLASLGWLLWCWWRTRASRADPDALWALVVVVALLTAPHTNPHELTQLILPAWVVVATGSTHGLARRWLALLWGGYLLRWLALLPGNPATAVLLSVGLLAMAAVLLGRACIARAGAARQARPIAGDDPFLTPRSTIGVAGRL
jgi:Glycosyltransferase family 87